jgi:hypothetical protein
MPGMGTGDHEADAPATGPAPGPAPVAAAGPTAAPTGEADDPQTRQLRAAGEHFMAGNFAAARQGVRELLRGELPPELKKPADELLRRMGLDPVAIWVAIGSTALFIVVVVLTFRR